VGGAIVIDGEPVTLLGVLPAWFRLSGAEMWEPLGPALTEAQLDRGNHPGFQVYARLRDGITVERARDEMRAIARDLEREYPATNHGIGVFVTPILDAFVGQVRRTLWLLLGAVGFVLLIACANVANVLLARALGRQREIAVRAALGASRRRLLRLFVLEGVLLATAGGALGLLLASWIVRAFRSGAIMALPRSSDLGIDLTVLAFTLLTAWTAGTLFGVAPAVHFRSRDLMDVLRPGASTTPTRNRQRLRWALVAGEIALATVLLVGAGLMIRTLARLAQVDPGFDPRNLIGMRVVVPDDRYRTREASLRFAERALERVRALPGVTGAAFAFPLDYISFSWTPKINFPDRPVQEGREPSVTMAAVSRDYFQTMGIPLRTGRGFDNRDRLGAPTAAIVNEAFAARYFPGRHPVGQSISVPQIDELKELTVVGVVGDTLRAGLAGRVVPELYCAYEQFPEEGALVVRTAGDPAALVRAIGAELRSLDADAAMTGVRSLDEALADTVGQRRAVRALLAAFAAVALALASIGVYGVVSFAVAQKTPELGIRVALGATARDILRLVLAQSFTPLAAGIVIGLGASLWLTRILSAQLYGITGHDPATFTMVTALLLLAAGTASLVPALRALRVDPLVALRQDR
jgi:putative ABC transport system permease protein